jgi:hypothetical protein
MVGDRGGAGRDTYNLFIIDNTLRNAAAIYGSHTSNGLVRRRQRGVDRKKKLSGIDQAARKLSRLRLKASIVRKQTSRRMMTAR